MNIVEYRRLCTEYPSLRSFFPVLEALHDNIVIVGKDGVILWVSSCFERNYGIAREAAVGRTTYDLAAERVFNPSVAALVLKTRRVVTLTESLRSGQMNIVTGVPVYDEDGELSFVVSYTIDPAYSLRLHDEYKKLQVRPPERNLPGGGVIYASSAMREALEKLRKVADLDMGVLITGESGVGKNVAARLLHHTGRRTGPLVEINCAGIPEALLESELFGYEPGSFTGARRRGKPGRIEQARGGTLFLDEIGEVPLHLQAKLLEVIQEKKFTKLGGDRPVEVDFRLVAATNQAGRSLSALRLFFGENQCQIRNPQAFQPGGAGSAARLCLAGQCARTAKRCGAERHHCRKQRHPAGESAAPHRVQCGRFRTGLRGCARSQGRLASLRAGHHPCRVSPARHHCGRGSRPQHQSAFGRP